MRQPQIDRVELEAMQAEDLINAFERKVDTFRQRHRDSVPPADWESLVSELSYVRHKLMDIRSDLTRLRHGGAGGDEL